MSVPVILDSNILIDHLNGIEEAQTEILYHSDRAISAITWIELMTAFKAKIEAGVMTAQDYTASESFLNAFPLIAIDQQVMEKAAEVRAHSLVLGGKKKMALPDAIIKATAEVTGRILVTRNIKDFDNTDPLVRVPYIAEIAHKTPPTVVHLFTSSDDLVITVSNVALAPPP